MGFEPFFVIGLPRSRTYWLSKFLTTDSCKVGHDSSCEYSSIEEMHKKMDNGICDTALAFHWKLLKGKIVIIERDYNDVLRSVSALGMVESASLRKIYDALQEAKQFYPCISYKDLQKKSVCKELFEYLTGEKFDSVRWKRMDKEIITVSVDEEMTRFKNNSENIQSLYGSLLC